MSLVQFALRLVRAAVFFTAAAGKVKFRSLEAYGAFGIPGPLRVPVSFLLPATQFLIGFLLLFKATARAGAIAALILLIAVTCVILYRLRHGGRPPCHCFGQVSNKPAGLTLRDFFALSGWGTMTGFGTWARTEATPSRGSTRHTLRRWRNLREVHRDVPPGADMV
jgi:hypothetical protein